MAKPLGKADLSLLSEVAASYGERAWVNLVGRAPLHAYSRMVRAVAEVRLPERYRRTVLGLLASRLGMDTQEAEYGLDDYRSFAELFSRRLRDGSRPIDPDASSIVCPADGKLTAVGQADSGRLIQAKGLDYALRELVDDEDLATALEGGPFVTVYLRPKDYHRVHAPVDADVVRVSRVAGDLLPVKPAFVRGQPNLYVRNERVVMELVGEVGRMALVCVGAAAVGSITTVFDHDGHGATGVARRVERGQEVAAFNLGSTVVLITQAGHVELDGLALQQELRVGQRVGRRL